MSKKLYNIPITITVVGVVQLELEPRDDNTKQVDATVNKNELRITPICTIPVRPGNTDEEREAVRAHQHLLSTYCSSAVLYGAYKVVEQRLREQGVEDQRMVEVKGPPPGQGMN